MLRENDIVLINGKKYTLGARIGGGLEGSIFDVKSGLTTKEGVDKKQRNYVIKIINDNNMTKIQKDDVYRHLKWLYDLGSRNKTIRQILTVPKALLDNQLGYIMLKADEHNSLKKYIDVPEDLSSFEDWYKHKFTLKNDIK